jgi:anti-sigma factor RsiW
MVEREGMMDTKGCEELGPWLADHAQGESGRMRERIERHLKHCPACREEMAFMQRMIEVGGEWEPGPRLGFEHRLEQVVTAAEEAADPRRRRRRLLAWTVGPAAVVAAALGGLLPTVEEVVTAVVASGWTAVGVVVAVSAGVFLVATPLLLAGARRRTEGGR